MKRGFVITTVLLALVLGSMAMAMAKNGNLPPGVQKKAAKGQPWPTGWQKKLKKGEVLNKAVFEAGVVANAPAPTGSIALKVDGCLLQLDPITRKILDSLNQSTTYSRG